MRTSRTKAIVGANAVCNFALVQHPELQLETLIRSPSLNSNFDKSYIESSTTNSPTSLNTLDVSSISNNLELGVAERDEEEVIGKTLEIDVEKFENVFSIIQNSSVKGSLQSSLDQVDLGLHEETKPEFSTILGILEALVHSVSIKVKKSNTYALWDLVKNIGNEEDSGFDESHIESLTTDSLTSVNTLDESSVSNDLELDVAERDEEEVVNKIPEIDVEKLERILSILQNSSVQWSLQSSLDQMDLGTIMTISKDRVKPYLKPDSWKLNEIFATSIVIGTYLASVSVLFYVVVAETTLFEDHFNVSSLSSSTEEISSAIHLQVSIISQALIFVTHGQNIDFASINGIGWGWVGIIWLYSLIFYIPLDIIKFTVHYALSGEAWNLLFDRKTAFTLKKDYGKEDREPKWGLPWVGLEPIAAIESVYIYMTKDFPMGKYMALTT
ncbi:hypothetical protein RJ641_031500 [Dillenia turbinata]|uniref:Uncharacterized protein n=1 Tax=Dillenia turbinata TaxID=194707 RepID=A0AAN8W2Q3_9MAGN